jgi:hypothetical protein
MLGFVSVCLPQKVLAELSDEGYISQKQTKVMQMLNLI